MTVTVLFAISVFVLILFYIAVALFKRFQIKLTVLFLLLRVHIFDFTLTNCKLYFIMQVLKLTVGMLGYLTLLVLHLG